MRKDIVIEWLVKRGQSLSDCQLSQMDKFQEMVLTAPMNLTAITSDEDFAVKHFIDSLTLLPWLDKLDDKASIVDIGTGAGFPGVPLKIARPSRDITLLDSLLKRILFLRGALGALGFSDTQCIHARAEEYTKKNGGCFDLVIARAVARLDKLAGYALPLVKPGGIFIAMKGPNTHEEINDAKAALDKLGGVVEEVETVEISQEISHTIIIIRRNTK